MPHGDRLGFVILAHGEHEVMLQTQASLAEDLPAVSALATTRALYVDVPSIAAEVAAVKDCAGARVLVRERDTPTGRGKRGSSIPRASSWGSPNMRRNPRRSVPAAAGPATRLGSRVEASIFVEAFVSDEVACPRRPPRSRLRRSRRSRRRTLRVAPKWCSCTASGFSRAAGSRWRELFEARGYATLAPGWPDDPSTVEEARARPDVFAGKTLGAIADHYAAVIQRLDSKPILVGHSFGGLITQKLAGQGLASVSVAIDPAPARGVLPLPVSSPSRRHGPSSATRPTASGR